MVFTRSDVTGNSAFWGGALSNNNGHLVVVESLINDNTASDHGGGIDNHGNTIVRNSSITENNALVEGGGVYNDGTFRAFNSDILGNTSGEFGFPDEFYGPAGVIVSGTNDDDAILGSNSDDIIRGRQGDDIIAGGAGDDDLFGQAGSDILIGFDPLIGLPILGSESVSPAEAYPMPMPGAGEIDVLTGGGGADLFVLGGFFGIESESGSVEPTEIGFAVAYSASGDDDYALIKDFSAQDTILLDGELIAIVQGNAALDLDLESGTGFFFTDDYLL